MAEFPAQPIPPRAFFEGFLPKAFPDAELPEGIAELDLALGVDLEGDGGGQWLLRLAEGSLAVGAGGCERAAVTLVQSVEDWRGALWEGRGASLGRAVAALFRLAAGERVASFPALRQSALEQLGTLSGSLKLVVSGGEGAPWSLSFAFGPRAGPERPTATLTVSEQDAGEIERGELDPVQAFLSGNVEITGDMSLFLQVQAAILQAEAG